MDQRPRPLLWVQDRPAQVPFASAAGRPRGAHDRRLTHRRWAAPAPFESDLARQLGQPLVFFNFGIPGAGPVIQLLQLQRLLAEGIKPDLLLFEIVGPLLDDRLGGNLQRLSAERFSWSDIQQIKNYPLHAHPLRQAWREARAVPWYAQRFNILSMVWPTLLPLHLRQDGYVGCDPCGWRAPMAVKHTPEEKEKLREVGIRGYRPTLASFQLGPIATGAVQMTLEECRRQQIPVVLVVSPEGPFFRSAYSDQAWPRIEAFLQRMGRDYQAPLINARSWIEEEDYFLDSHHLLPDGAAQFTERLSREAILPLLRGQWPGQS